MGGVLCSMGFTSKCDLIEPTRRPVRKSRREDRIDRIRTFIPTIDSYVGEWKFAEGYFIIEKKGSDLYLSYGGPGKLLTKKGDYYIDTHTKTPTLLKIKTNDILEGAVGNKSILLTRFANPLAHYLGEWKFTKNNGFIPYTMKIIKDGVYYYIVNDRINLKEKLLNHGNYGNYDILSQKNNIKMKLSLDGDTINIIFYKRALMCHTLTKPTSPPIDKDGEDVAPIMPIYQECSGAYTYEPGVTIPDAFLMEEEHQVKDTLSRSVEHFQSEIKSNINYMNRSQINSPNSYARSANGMNYVFSKENQYTVSGKFIPKGQPDDEPRYPVENHGYVASTGNAFYKINKIGANYPYADHASYTAYTQDKFQTDYVSNYGLDATSFNHGTIREPRKCPTTSELMKYKDDFLLLNNLEGTKHYYNIKKN